MRRRPGVGEHDCPLGAVADIAAFASFGAREQRRGEQGERERPFQPLREDGVGEPRREQLALPSPAPRRPAPGARRQGAPREAEDARRGGRRRPMASGARLGSVDHLLQGVVVRDPENLGGGVERRTPMPQRARGQFPPGDEPPSRRSGIGARPGEMQRVAQSRLVLGAAGAQNAGGGGAERQALAENAGPGRVFADDGVEAGKRRAGEKGRFGFVLGRFDGARPGGKRRRRGGRRHRSRWRISLAQHGERLAYGGAFA